MKYMRALFSPVPSAMVASLLAGLALVATPAEAGLQWKWRDPSGAIQYSDRPPPPGTPDSAILSRPSASRAPAVSRPAPDAASAAASGDAPAASSPAPKASDPELEAKRKKAEDDKLAKQKADEEKMAKQKAENCQRARGYQKSLQDGMRVMRTNAKGEHEILDDKARAEEMQRANEVIQNNCK